MVGQHLVMCKEKCLPAVVVRRIIESIFVIVPCLLVFFINLTVHYVYVSGPSLCHLCPFFVQITLILAKHVVVLAQFLELHHVRLAQKFIAVINYGLPIQTVCFIFSMGGINTFNESPQNFLKLIECMTIIHKVGVLLSNIIQLTRQISGVVIIVTVPSTLACALNHIPFKEYSSTASRNLWSSFVMSRALGHL